MEPCGFLWPRWQGSLAPVLLTEGGKKEGLKYTECLLTRVWYSHTNTSDTNLWALGKVRNCDFQWLQDRHGSGSCFIQKVPHTRLQKMWLRRRLGNCYSNLPKMSCFTTQQRCTSKWNDRVLQKHYTYPCTEVVDSLWRETSSPQCSQSEESGIIPVSTNRWQKKGKDWCPMSSITRCYSC